MLYRMIAKFCKFFTNKTSTQAVREQEKDLIPDYPMQDWSRFDELRKELFKASVR